MHNPWINPVETGTLKGEFASPQLNKKTVKIDPKTGMPLAEEEGSTENMAKALDLIQQQMTIVGRLTSMLQKSRGKR